MSVQIIDDGFGNKFYALLEECVDKLLIVSPFIGRSTAESLADLLEKSVGLSCTIITRFYREDFINGASSLHGLEQLLHAGAELYALQDLHTKLYIFDNHSVITGSFNFTFFGFYKNHEFGMLMDQEPFFANECIDYVNGLLNSIRSTGNWLITEDRIEREKGLVNTVIANRKRNPSVTQSNVTRWGAEIGEVSRSGSVIPPAAEKDARDFIEDSLKQPATAQTRKHETGIWIKFEGSAEERVPNETIYIERKNRVYEHNDRTFFKRQPSGIKKGDLVFMAVVSFDAQERETPIIVGYAEAEGFESGNVIGPEDKFFKATNGEYPYFIRLTNGRFLQAPVKHGISLLDLCRDLKSDLYPTYKEHLWQILSTHHQKSHLQITETAKKYLLGQLETIFGKHGAVSDEIFKE